MARRSLRLVLKFGSGILSNPQGNTLDRRQFDRLGREVAALRRAGHECLIVSSGAVAAGMAALGLKARPAGLPARQAFTLERLLAGGVVPVINENDSVAVEELNFGDNDRLSAEVAILIGADRLIILTSVDGLLDAAGRVVPVVADLDAVASLVHREVGRVSTGGMVTKLDAARRAVAAGIAVGIASGRRPGVMAAIVAGRKSGTHFPAERR
ncbi:MAG: hypothetical protein HY302_01015 [Opitutae bacterium]|nr:hypothetical protein [Opitutae bacterium]